MKRIHVHFTRGPGQSERVGTLAEAERRFYFQYDPQFLQRGLNLSPFRLPLTGELFEHRDREFGPLPGVFDDSLPDGWGLLLMNRHFLARGLDLATIGPLDRLLWLGTRTMGALTYHPPARGVDADTAPFDLHALARQSQEILSGQAADVLPQLLRAGGSPGGTRPKVLVGYNPHTGEVLSGEDDLPVGFEHWLVKFPAKADLPEPGAIEYAYSLMASAAGIALPPTRLFETREGDRFFGIRRFDRQPGNRRRHVHTFGNLIQCDFRIPSADYGDLLKATTLLTRKHGDLLEAVRRMTFNVLAHNRDDHVKNFAYILDDQTGEWSLSPAYDLTWSGGPGGEHTMTIGGEGRQPTVDHLLGVAAKAGIADSQAGKIVQEVRQAVGQWKAFAERARLGSATAESIAASIQATP